MICSAGSMRLVKACLRPALLKIDSPLENTRTNRRADEICADEFPSDPFDGENGVEVEINNCIQNVGSDSLEIPDSIDSTPQNLAMKPRDFLATVRGRLTRISREARDGKLWRDSQLDLSS